MKSKKSLLGWLERYWWVVCLGVGAVVATMSMILSIGQSIWFDEGYSILIAQQPVGELLGLTAVDAHPPFYYLLLKLLGSLFGFDDSTLRLLSALLMGGAIAVILAVIKRQFSVKIALALVPFLIFAPFILRYGYEVRMYALATLIGAGATYVLVRAQASQRWGWWVAYAVLVALGMYTLYMMVALWLAHGVWLLVSSIRRRQSWKTWQWPYAYIGAIILFVPYIPTFFYQLTNSALPGIGQVVTLTTVVDMTSVLTVYTSEWQLGGWTSLLLGLVLVLIIASGVVSYRRASKADRSLIIFWLTLAIVPVIFFTLSSLPPREPIFINRYLAHISVYLYATAALLVILAWRYKYRALAGVAAIGLLSLLVIGVVTLQRTGNFIFERQQYPMTQLIRDQVLCDENQVVVADDPYTYIDSFQYFRDCDLRFYSPTDLERKGGYAPLHGSVNRIDSSTTLITPRLAHLHWEGQTPSFVIDDRYQLVSSAQYGNQVVDSYELISE